MYPIILIWDVFSKSREVGARERPTPSRDSSLPARHKTVNLGSKRQRLGSGFVVLQRVPKLRASSPMIGERIVHVALGEAVVFWGVFPLRSSRGEPALKDPSNSGLPEPEKCTKQENVKNKIWRLVKP